MRSFSSAAAGAFWSGLLLSSLLLSLTNQNMFAGAQEVSYSLGVDGATDCVAPAVKVTDEVECRAYFAQQSSATLFELCGDVGICNDIPTGCSHYQGATFMFDSGTNNVSNPNLQPVCKTTAPPAAGAGGDPHVIAFFGQAFTYQGICDTVLSSSPDAIGGLGFRMHARLTAAKKKKGEAGYSYISEVVVEIGIDRYEFQSEEAKLYLNSKLHPLDDDEKFTPTRFSAEPPYALKKTVKGQRKHIVEYKFDFFNGSSVTIRSNRHFKMIFVDIVGTFDGADLHGLLGSPHKKGLFKRNGENMEGKDINDYGQDWQVLVSEPKLFMDAEREPQSPSKCIVIMDTTSGIDGNDATAQLRGRRRLLEIGDGGTAAVDTIMEIAAQNACSHIIHSKMKEYCIDDVMATGNLEVADEPFWEHY